MSIRISLRDYCMVVFAAAATCGVGCGQPEPGGGSGAPAAPSSGSSDGVPRPKPQAAARPELALLIGRHGATLEALQEVTRAAVQRQVGGRAFVNLDVEGYRARRREILERRARSAAAKVRRSGKAQALEPMPAFERKVVHDALTRFNGVETTSEGEEPNRRVVISPA